MAGRLVDDQIAILSALTNEQEASVPLNDGRNGHAWTLGRIPQYVAGS
jgi:hypothetical protein